MRLALALILSLLMGVPCARAADLAPVEPRTENNSRIAETSRVLGRFRSDNAKPN